MSAQASNNPSHLLLSRNPRSPAHPQLAPTSTSRHPPSPAIFGWGSSTDDLGRARTYSAPLPIVDRDAVEQDAESAEIEDEVVDVHPTFRKDAALPGRIKVIVGRYEFWCHKEVLWFTCPFFQDVLQGSWAETSNTRIYESSPSPLPSHRNSFIAESSVETDTDPDRSDQPETLPSVPEIRSPRGVGRPQPLHIAEEAEDGAEMLDEGSEGQPQTASVYLDAMEDGLSVAEILKELRELPDRPTSTQALQVLDPGSTVLPQTDMPVPGDMAFSPPISPSPPPLPPALSIQADSALPAPTIPRPLPSLARASRRRSSARQSFSSVIRPPSVSVRINAGRSKEQEDRVDAVVQLHEESAVAFQDFLFWAYPHLECKVTWTNAENLLALACKLIVPALQKLCEHFLLTHASGRPIMALALAEQHDHAELFKEASRFVLDQPTWNAEEMEDLSEKTQLKLSQRRMWFLERLLKLSSIDVRKEYTCRPDCPDPARCQFYLDEKWRQAGAAVCRYGPPQPSVAFKCLRQLETFPTYPSLVMPHPLCQSAAKSWVMLLYDRMFQPKPLAGPIAAGTEKYWLFITLH